MATHQSVLLQESIEGLVIKSDGIYFDGTFGRGGHSREILRHLNDNGRLYAIDKDVEAIAYATTHFSEDKRFHIFQGSFARIEEFAIEAGVLGKVDGILLDLGVSSPQLDNPERGFSFIQQGPLDMRMDLSQSMSAAQFVNEAEADEMASILDCMGKSVLQGGLQKPLLRQEALPPLRQHCNWLK